jgi:hypothetical protein
MSKIRKTFEIVLMAIVFGFIVVLTIIVFGKLFGVNNENSIERFQGAFAGAFFAFLFVRLAEFLNLIYKRQAKNRSALIKLEHNLNECLNIINDNIFVIDNYISIFREYRPEDRARLFSNEFLMIPIDKDIPIELTNIEYINEVFILQDNLRRLNVSMSSLNKMTEGLGKYFIEKNLDHTTYVVNMTANMQKYEELKKFLLETQKDTIGVMASGRIQLRRTPFIFQIIHFLIKTKFTSSTQKEKEKEINALMSEIKEMGDQSEERIHSVLQDNGKKDGK